MQFRHNESDWTGYCDLKTATIPIFEGRNYHHFSINKCSFQTSRFSRNPVPMNSKPCTARAWAANEFGDHQVNLHVYRGVGDRTTRYPCAYFFARGKPGFSQGFRELWGWPKVLGIDSEVSVRRELRYCKISSSRVEIDRLGAHENEGLSLIA